MKKILLLSLFGVLFNQVFAQVPNGNFESWTTVGTYEDPTGWGTANSFTSSLGIYTCTKSTDMYEGNFAALLTAQFALITTVPGVIGDNASINLTSFQILGGYPETNRYAWFSGYYKGTPAGGDTNLIAAVLTKWNASLGKKDTIAIASLKETGSVSAYQRFQVPFVYFNSANPDTAVVLASNSTNLLSAHTGTTLYVDSLNLFGVYTGISTSVNAMQVKLFPNPTSSLLNVYLPETTNGDFCISNMIGVLLKTIPVNKSNLSVSVADLPVGLYGYVLKNEAGEIISSGKFSVQR